MAKPGVMFYFDVRPCIKRLDAAEKGRLLDMQRNALYAEAVKHLT